jgi:hypothetical protein
MRWIPHAYIVHTSNINVCTTCIQISFVGFNGLDKGAYKGTMAPPKPLKNIIIRAVPLLPPKKKEKEKPQKNLMVIWSKK